MDIVTSYCEVQKDISHLHCMIFRTQSQSRLYSKYIITGKHALWMKQSPERPNRSSGATGTMKLILFSGLPGTGKSTLAEAIGRHLSTPVFAKDWLEATLLQSELIASNPDKPLGSAGYELLTTLAERQFMLHQSVILDSVASTQSIRNIWRRLCEQYQAHWCVIECICSDEAFHRSQLTKRQRRIPGWHELEWADVEKVKQYYQPWEGERLVLDMIHPLVENLSQAIAYCEI
jgi:predicted kinase